MSRKSINDHHGTSPFTGQSITNTDPSARSSMAQVMSAHIWSKGLSGHPATRPGESPYRSFTPIAYPCIRPTNYSASEPAEDASG